MDYFQIDLASDDHKQLDAATIEISKRVHAQWDAVRGPTPLPKNTQPGPPHRRRLKLTIGNVDELQRVRGIVRTLGQMELPTDVEIAVQDHCSISDPLTKEPKGNRYGLGGEDRQAGQVGNDAAERQASTFIATVAPRESGRFASLPSYEGDNDYKD